MVWWLKAAVIVMLAGVARAEVQAEVPPAVPPEATRDVPRLDQCRVLHTEEPGTQVRQGWDDPLWLDLEVRPAHDECRARYTRRPLEFGERRVRAPLSEHELPSYERLEGVDTRGRPWFWRGSVEGNRVAAAWIEGGKLRQRDFPGNFRSVSGGCAARWPWLGHEILEQANGRIWVTGQDRLHMLAGEEVEEVLLPKPKEQKDADDLVAGPPNIGAWYQQLVGDGDSVWLVRGMYANCHTTGSFVVQISEGRAELVARTRKEYVTDLVRKGASMYLLIGVRERRSGEREDQYIPTHILRIGGEETGVERDAVRREVAKLASDVYTEREAASAYLKRLPNSQIKVLEEALRVSKDPEQMGRLREIIQWMAKRESEPPRAELAGLAAGRLVLVDKQGRRYVQGWKDRHPDDTMVVVEGDKAVTVKLPVAGGGAEGFCVDLQAADGRVWGHDGEKLYVLEPGKWRWETAADLGAWAGLEMRLLAVRGTQICLGVARKFDFQAPYVPVWVDLARPRDLPELEGEKIAEGMEISAGEEGTHPVVSANEGERLWFVQVKGARRAEDGTGMLRDDLRARLCRVNERGQVEELAEEFKFSSNPSVWVLGQDTAIVVAECSDKSGMVWYDRGITDACRSLADLVEKYHARILETMPDGTGFRSGPSYEDTWLLRAGDGLYIEESLNKRFDNGSGRMGSSRVFREGEWAVQTEEEWGHAKAFEPWINRVAGVDAKRGQVLGFVDGYKALKWISLENKAVPDDLVHRKDEAWAWTWPDEAKLPRFEAAWTLTPAAAERWLQIHPKRLEEAKARGSTSPELDVEYESGDFAAFRRWDAKGWREYPGSLYGGTVAEDAAGGVWHFRVREAEVVFRDGTRQWIGLDAGVAGQYRLAVADAATVWVASVETLTKFVLERPEGKLRWKAAQQWRLPRLGAGFAGPWVAGGRVYWVSGGTLWKMR